MFNCGSSPSTEDRLNLKQEMIECKTNAHKITEENEKLTEALIQVHIQKELLQDQLHDTKVKIDELKGETDSEMDLKETLEKTEKELKETKISLLKANQEFLQANEKTTEFKKEIKKLRLELSALKKATNDDNASSAKKVTENDETLAKENKNLIQQVFNFKSERGKLNRMISELNSDTETLTFQLENEKYEKAKIERMFMDSQEACEVFQNLAREMHHMDVEKETLLQHSEEQIKIALNENDVLSHTIHTQALKINMLEQQQGKNNEEN